MAPSTMPVSSWWPTTVSRKPLFHKSSAMPSARAWPSLHQTFPIHCDCPFCLRDSQHTCIYCSIADPHSSWSPGLLPYPSSISEPLGPVTDCPQCWRRPKHPDLRFCSIFCGQAAARSAPEVKYLPARHVLSINVATQFVDCWDKRSVPPPKVLAVYMITWTESSTRAFERYRDDVEAAGQFQSMGYFSGNEQKRFRSTHRACTLGEQGNFTPCQSDQCWLCETIRLGFEPHLLRKRNVPLNGSGIRLGAGIYTSHTSSKADKYAKNIHDPNSNIKVMLVCRVVIGRPYTMYEEDHTIRRPPLGYDCVYAQPGFDFAEDEYVVYDADAIRPAYLVLYETAGGA